MKTGASCLVGLLQGPRGSFPCSAIILKVASLLVISDLLEKNSAPRRLLANALDAFIYSSKNTTISAVSAITEWLKTTQKMSHLTFHFTADFS